MDGLDGGSHSREACRTDPPASVPAAPALGKSKTFRQIAIVIVAVAAITAAHLSTPRSYFLLHSVFQHLYYVPVILGAIFFGWPGGLLAAACTAMCYVPHIHHWQQTNPNYVLNQYAELFSFFLVGIVTGLLADRERRRAWQLEEKSVELERANRELASSFERAKHADRLAAVGQLAAGLAHEIRHPLASIEGAVNVLANPQSPSDLQEEFRGIITKECRRLAALLTQLLDFARPRRPTLRNVDPRLTISEVIRLAESSIPHNKVRIITDLPGGLPHIECDEEQLKQVVLNLVMNAVQAMPNGGSVTISARCDGTEFTVAVSDEGFGIPPDLQSRIFDPFFTTRESGTGLGLAVVQQIVTQHGGSIQVKRNATAGSSFVVRIPVHTREAP